MRQKEGEERKGKKWTGETYPRHPSINDEIRPVHEPALIARQEKYRLRLLDGFAEAAGREMDFTTVALGRVVAEPVLEEGRAILLLHQPPCTRTHLFRLGSPRSIGETRRER